MKLSTEQNKAWEGQLKRSLKAFVANPERADTVERIRIIKEGLTLFGVGSTAKAMACAQDKVTLAAYGHFVRTLLNESPVVTPEMSEDLDSLSILIRVGLPLRAIIRESLWFYEVLEAHAVYD